MQIEHHLAADAAGDGGGAAGVRAAGRAVRRAILDTAADDSSSLDEVAGFRDGYYAGRSGGGGSADLFGGVLLTAEERAEETAAVHAELTRYFNRLVSGGPEEDAVAACDFYAKLSSLALRSPSASECATALFYFLCPSLRFRGADCVGFSAGRSLTTNNVAIAVAQKVVGTAALNAGPRSRKILRDVLEQFGPAFLAYPTAAPSASSPPRSAPEDCCLVVAAIGEQLDELHQADRTGHISNLVHFVDSVFGLSSADSIMHGPHVQQDLLRVLVVPHLRLASKWLPAALRVLLSQLGDPPWAGFPAVAAAPAEAMEAPDVGSYMLAALTVIGSAPEAVLLGLCVLLENRMDLEPATLSLVVKATTRYVSVVLECQAAAGMSLAELCDAPPCMLRICRRQPGLSAAAATAVAAAAGLAAKLHWSVGLYLLRIARPARCMERLSELDEAGHGPTDPAEPVEEKKRSVQKRLEVFIENALFVCGVLVGRVDAFAVQLSDTRQAAAVGSTAGEAATVEGGGSDELVLHILQHPTEFRHAPANCLPAVVPFIRRNITSDFSAALMRRVIAM